MGAIIHVITLVRDIAKELVVVAMDVALPIARILVREDVLVHAMALVLVQIIIDSIKILSQ